MAGFGNALRHGFDAAIETGLVLLSPCRRRRDYGAAARAATGCEVDTCISADQETGSDLRFMERDGSHRLCRLHGRRADNQRRSRETDVGDLPIRPLFWLVWRRSGLGLQRLRRPSSPAALPHSSRDNKLGCRRPSLTLRSTGCSRPDRRLTTAIETAQGGFGNQSGERQWLPSATSSNRTTTSSAARSSPSPSQGYRI
jgi:hypothetical protein